MQNNQEDKVLITTVPFGQYDKYPLELLEANNIKYDINPLGRRLKAEELSEMIVDYSILIAGTEPINQEVLNKANNLKLISRVGIGLDNIDLKVAKKKNIIISYTPDAPAPAVGELTIGLMLSSLRHIHLSNMKIHQKSWERYSGFRLSELNVGIIGAGRIGANVIKHLQGFNCKRILVNDINEDIKFPDFENVEFAEKEKIYREADIISLHLPLTSDTFNLITKEEISCMRSNTILINTSRGGIIHEEDLAEALKSKRLYASAIDTFIDEPYSGPLTNLDNCLLTAHMGSMTADCRASMEIQATEEVVRYLNNAALLGIVPESEFFNQTGI
jgi:D-3-phosphoglycerate dehydrogenase / 2-oxoglutarate reductase